MIQSLSDYYRVPEGLLGDNFKTESSGDAGFFQFGRHIICYGQCASGVSKNVEDARLYDASENAVLGDSEIRLPFDPVQVVNNLRLERYQKYLAPGRERFGTHEWILKTYYCLRSFLPFSIRKRLQRVYFSDWRNLPFPDWPVDFTVDTLHEKFLRFSMNAEGLERVPFIWFWPDGAPSCLIMTHDVETIAGRDFTPQLMDIDDRYGIKASFQVIPEQRYKVSNEYISEIRDRGFEFNIHDLNHDGHLYQKREEFLRRAKRINEYVHRYNSKGFRAGAMYRVVDWYDAFEFSYDMSLSNVAHLEPKRGGCCTVFPFFIGNVLELPLTTAQDYSVLNILDEYSIDLWMIQTNMIRRRNGLMSFIVHPDYMIDLRARRVYELLLDYLQKIIFSDNVWAVLPGEVDKWWRARSQMNLVQKGEDWEIVGPEKERARIAYAVSQDNHIVYEISGCPIRPRESH